MSEADVGTVHEADEPEQQDGIQQAHSTEEEKRRIRATSSS